jgi:nicotinamidase-related amidase
MAIWDPFLTEHDRRIYEAAGYGARGGFGSRPALIVVDVSHSFCGEPGVPLLESIVTWRTSCGPAAWRAVPVIETMLDTARSRRLPVFFSTGIDPRPDGFDRGAWAYKNSRTAEDCSQRAPGRRGNDIVDEIAPLPHEFLIPKMKPSVFHATPLLGYLLELGVDTLIVCGTTTSGCVRDTVLDGFNHNFHIAVVEDATFDRFESSHAISLFDMDAKYADVMGSEEAIAYLKGVESGLYDDKISFPRSIG